MNITVAVTGMNARADNPGPGLAVARCLKASNIPIHVIGLGYEALDAGLYHRGLVDKGYLLPYPSNGENVLLSRLSALHQREQFDVIIPCLDAEMSSFANLAPILSDMGIRSFIPNNQLIDLRSKDKLPELATAMGVSSPKTQTIYKSDFFNHCLDQGWRYPMMVKGLYYDAKLVHTTEQAIKAFHAIANEWGFPVLVQSYLAGEEVNLAGLGDGKGKLAGAVMMKKRALTDKGKGWAGVTIHDQALLAAAERFCALTQWRGGFEIEMLRDDKTGQLHLIEINPRFPAWIYLSAGVGCNLPELSVRLALGEQDLTLSHPSAGMMFIRYAEEAIVSLTDFESITVLGETLHIGL